MRILAVDDDDLALELLVASLEDIGYLSIVTAQSGEAAIELITALSDDLDSDEPEYFECFLFDIQMPGMDGIELCERVRSIPQYSRTPIIMITSMKDRDFVERAFLAGANDYVTKPFDILELRTRLRSTNSLVNERKKGIEGFLISAALENRERGENMKGYDEPFEISGVPKFWDVWSLEEHLLQLRPKQASKVCAFGMRLRNAHQMFSEIKRENFEKLVVEVAAVISRHVPSEGTMLSYFGSGIYLCITNRRELAAPLVLENIINSEMMAISTVQPHELPSLHVGPQAESSILHSSDISGVLITALTSLERSEALSSQEKKHRKPAAFRSLKYRVSRRA